MSVTAIPFRSPPPFDLPPHVLDDLRHQPLTAAAERVIALLDQLDAADLLAVAFAGADGALVPGPVLAGDENGRSALAAALEEVRSRGGQDVFHQAVERAQPLLLMGELEANEEGLVPSALAQHLLAGKPRASLGFVYALPLQDTAGKVHGALVLHRPLEAGPLNHDQPAIAHALAQELAARAAQGGPHGA